MPTRKPAALFNIAQQVHPVRHSNGPTSLLQFIEQRAGALTRDGKMGIYTEIAQLPDRSNRHRVGFGGTDIPEGPDKHGTGRYAKRGSQFRRISSAAIEVGCIDSIVDHGNLARLQARSHEQIVAQPLRNRHNRATTKIDAPELCTGETLIPPDINATMKRRNDRCLGQEARKAAIDVGTKQMCVDEADTFRSDQGYESAQKTEVK